MNDEQIAALLDRVEQAPLDDRPALLEAVGRGIEAELQRLREGLPGAADDGG